ncbi:MAG: tRNA-dihydrouridine synthase, partial [Actinobacteria bacterium]|nr:tRNA-dihydrouridine synthase [Actinomycetota bacterium]
IFRSLAEGVERPPTVAERFHAVRRHLRHYVEFAGMRRAATEMRKHLCWYLKGLPGGAAVRQALHALTTEHAYLELLDGYEQSLTSTSTLTAPCT